MIGRRSRPPLPGRLLNYLGAFLEPRRGHLVHTYTVQMKLNHKSLGFGIEPPLITTRKFAAESGTLFHPSIRPRPEILGFAFCSLLPRRDDGVNLCARPIRLSVSLSSSATLLRSHSPPFFLLFFSLWSLCPRSADRHRFPMSRKTLLNVQYSAKG